MSLVPMQGLPTATPTTEQTPLSATSSNAIMDADGHPLTPAPWTGESGHVKPVFDFGGGGLGLINDVEEEEELV